MCFAQGAAENERKRRESVISGERDIRIPLYRFIFMGIIDIVGLYLVIVRRELRCP